MKEQPMVKSEIEILKQIQSLDSENYACLELIEEIPNEINEIDRSIESEKKTLHSIEEELRSIQLRQKEKEAELQDKESAIKKYEAQLAQVKTNKEYSSLQAEIRTLQADNSLLEESIIKFFDQVDECQGKLKAEQLHVQEVEKTGKVKKTVLEQKINEAKQKIGILTQQKQELIKKVNPEIASLYERIVKNKRGLALVKVDGEVCSACQMRLRPQQINEIAMAEEIILCEQCSRILYNE